MLWQHVMRDVVRLHGAIDPTPTTSPAVEPEQPAAPPGKPMPRPRKQPRRAKALPEVDLTLFVPPAKPVVQVQRMVHPVEEIGKRYPGVDNYSWRTFSEGAMRVQGRLDLHGLVAQDAFRRLMDFMDVAHVRGYRCVEIITGLGTGVEGGILRRELPHWLARPEIRHRVLGLAYPHAANKGSVRVLLRRRRA
ncbi:MAG: Smr/MutS family protein [Acetobacter orientalis]|uniref:Smr/MutS family protein n=1 Tax=Acetobacter orientalis TaxID=146474 RepID=UPI0039E8C831